MGRLTHAIIFYKTMSATKLSTRIRTRVEKLHYSPTLAINEQVHNAREDGVQILHMGFGRSFIWDLASRHFLCILLSNPH